MNREAWLTALVGFLRAHFEMHGYPLPPTIHVSVGWPASRALRRTNRRVGECWGGVQSQDGGIHIFISPIHDNAYDVAATLIHELLHAAVGLQEGHGKKFREAARAIGVRSRRPTETAIGPELTEMVVGLLKGLPPWPHEPIMLLEGGPRKKKASSRLHTLKCPECGYTVYITKKWLDHGLLHANGLQCPIDQYRLETPQ